MEIMPIVHWIRDYSILFMLATFTLIVATTFWPGRKKRFERDARIPFDEDR